MTSPEINGFNAEDYVTEQVFYPSADGTKIPMFLTYRKGIERNGKNPVYLYGYGGFNITLNPSFSANRLIWLETAAYTHRPISAEVANMAKNGTLQALNRINSTCSTTSSRLRNI